MVLSYHQPTVGWITPTIVFLSLLIHTLLKCYLGIPSKLDTPTGSKLTQVIACSFSVSMIPPLQKRFQYKRKQKAKKC